MTNSMKKLLLSLTALILLATTSISSDSTTREYLVVRDADGRMLLSGEVIPKKSIVTFSGNNVSFKINPDTPETVINRSKIKSIRVYDHPVADLLDIQWSADGTPRDISAAAVPIVRHDKASSLPAITTLSNNPPAIPAPTFHNTFTGADIVAEGSATDKNTTTGTKYTQTVNTQYYQANYGALSNPAAYQAKLADGFSMELLFRLDQQFPTSTYNETTKKYEEPASSTLPDAECKVFSGTQSGGYGILIRKESSANRQIAFGVVTATTGTCYVTSDVRPQAGLWYHVVGTYRRGQLLVYVNGVCYDNASATVRKAVENEDIVGPNALCKWIGIGADPKLADPNAPNKAANNGTTWGPAAESAFPGSVAIARVYSDPLDADQVELLYRETNVEQYNAAITPSKSATIYGTVDSDAGPVKGAVVSDGQKCAVTNHLGFYQLESTKPNGSVFISVPSGYEPLQSGVFPQIYRQLSLPSGLPEKVSFQLKKVSGQENFKMLMLGDMHLANRSNDLAQYKKFTTDLKAYIAANPGKKIYAVTLGDMTWDGYWASQKYELPNYVTTINANLSPLMVYQCIGNHDHDPKAIASNAQATAKFVKNLAPAWYSFNIGSVHFMVIDNIDCIDYDGVKDRPYVERLYGTQMEWIKNDLALVPPQTPIYVISHASLFAHKTTAFNTFSLRTAGNYTELISLFRSREVHFVNGHLHTSHTALPADAGPKTFNTATYGYTKVWEHNIPAVCSDWWYSGWYNPGTLVSTDGTPSGWGVFNFTGTAVQWLYKCAGLSENIQWRAYDLNNVNFAKYTFTKSSQAVFDEFKKQFVDAPAFDGSRKNQMLINAFCWNSACKISVKTVDGTPLTATPVAIVDPLSIQAMTIPYWDRGVSTIPGTLTKKKFHFFEVQCPDADTDIIITMTDPFDRTDSRTIQRPLTFSTATYKAL